MRGWQLVMFLVDNDLLPKPTVCCISGRSDRIQWHSESYYHWRPYALNQSIHLALHRRFNAPDRWRVLVDQYAVTGEEWFARLSLVPADLAGQLRAEHGDQIADIFDRVPLPSGIQVPFRQIYRGDGASA
ncbi:hypothetical protein ASC75_02450 [Aminobacter sp. DSM 101952]|nr:hypothetical protein ASC75_02450 [Aminobacter sp. DSM 101952]